MSRPLEESLARCAMTSAATGPGTLASPATGMIAQAATRRAGYLVSSCVAAPKCGRRRRPVHAGHASCRREKLGCAGERPFFLAGEKAFKRGEGHQANDEAASTGQRLYSGCEPQSPAIDQEETDKRTRPPTSSIVRHLSRALSCRILYELFCELAEYPGE
jgi:hypothetical protein